jgi:HK97 family phage major capsid protein
VGFCLSGHQNRRKTMSLVTAKDLREERAKLWSRQKEILEGANGSLSEESRSEFDRIESRMGEMAEDIRRIEAHEAAERELRTSTRITAAGPVEVVGDEAIDHEKRYEAAFNAYAIRGHQGLTAEQRSILETRTPQGTPVAAGGYTIPQAFSNELEIALKQYGGVRQAARVMATDSGALMPWPTVNDTANKGRLLAENTQVTNTAMTFGVVNFGAFKFSSDSILVSEELLQDSAFDLNSFVGASLGERLGRITNEFFTTGTGNSQPQGVVPFAAEGHVSTAAAGTYVIGWEDLVALEHSVDPAYRASASARWMLNDATLRDLKLIKDQEDRPIWLPGVAVREPDLILGYQYTVNQDMAAQGENAKPLLFGDFSKFVVRDVRGVTLLRLVERYADFHQVGFLAFLRADSRGLNAGTGPIKYFQNAAGS